MRDAATELARDEDVTTLDAATMAAAIRAGRLGAEECLEAHLARVRRWNPALAAVVALDEEAAREAARAADADAARGSWRGPLHGVPMTVKDTWNVAGLPASIGVPWLRGNRPARDAAAVARLRTAGAIVWGKTNLPFASYDWQCRNGFFPRGANPWDARRGPGGSSGGSAAALAARFTPLELGSDVAGSIRVPAHCCGVVGLRPSEGLVPLDGHGDVPGGVHALRHLVVGGPLARSVPDLRLAMRVLAPDVDWAPRAAAIAPLRLAWTDEVCGRRVDRASAEVLAAAVTALRAAGASIERSAYPLDAEALMATWGAIQGFEMRAGMPGPSLPGTGTTGRLLVRAAFGRGAFARVFGRGWTAAPRDYFRALEARDVAIAAWDAWARQRDAWLTPVALTPALAHQRTGRPVVVDGRRVPYADVFAWWSCPSAVTAHPVVVVPAGTTPAGLPVGVQIHGRRGHDAALLDVAEAIAAVLGPTRTPSLR